MMLVKCSFGDDIRRFTIDHPFTTFSGLEYQLATLYKIPRGNFKIFYTDNEGDKIYISTNEELAAAVAQATSPSILRITIVDSCESSKTNSEEQFNFGNEEPKETPSSSSYSVPVFSLKDLLYNSGYSTSNTIGINTQVDSSHVSTNTSSPQISSSSTNTKVLNLTNISTNTKQADTCSASTATSFSPEDVDMDELFSNPKFQDRLATVISHAIATRAFSQLLQNMIPQMTDILKESIRATATPSHTNDMVENFEEDEDVPPNLSLNSMLTASSSSSSSDTFEVDLPEIEEDIEEFFEEEMPSLPADLPTPAVQEPEDIEQDQEVLEQNEEVPELNPAEEEANYDNETFENESPENEIPENEAEEPEQFVIVDNKPEVKKETPTPILNSFLSLFKSSQKKTPRPQEIDNLDNVQIPNLEDLLNQLDAMGFTDKEQNIKVLRFHKKFNEGLDEVVEELLHQN